MDRALLHRLAKPSRSESHFAHRGVLDEHGHYDVAARRDLGNRCCYVRARLLQRRGLRGELIEHGELVPRVEEAPRHSLSHAAEANEPYFHVFLERLVQREGATLTRSFARCKPCGNASAMCGRRV